jgi:hypothetical protein
MKQGNSYILTINGGSSRIKFAFYRAGEPLKRELYGKVDRIGLKGWGGYPMDRPASEDADLNCLLLPRRTRSRRTQFLKLAAGQKPAANKNETHGMKD